MMPPMLRSAFAVALVAVSAVPPALSQETPPRPALAPSPEPPFLVRTWPKDRGTPVAVVGAHTITLGELVEHLDARHYPGFGKALDSMPGMRAYLQSDLIAPWVRQFADLDALRQTFVEPPIDEDKLKAAQSEALRQGFQGFLDTYVADLRQRGLPTDLSQRRVNSLLADWQLRHGLGCELQGLLDYLEPGDYTTPQLREFFLANARAFGGQVNIEHILVQHRDGGTGILLADAGIARANTRLADIKARLRPDGSNFADIARQFSDDTRTGREGGKLDGVHRFDDRLPAGLCRAAWSLRDGEVSDVVETQYGWHIVRRVDFSQQVFVLFTDAAIPDIKQVMRRAMQEERLFHAREQAKVSLRL